MRDGLGLIKGLASANAGDEIAVFLLVSVDLRIAEAPQIPVVGFYKTGAVAGAFGSNDTLGDFSLTAVHLPALAEHPGAVRVLEFDSEVVVDVALGLTLPGLATTQS